MEVVKHAGRFKQPLDPIQSSAPLKYGVAFTERHLMCLTAGVERRISIYRRTSRVR